MRRKPDCNKWKRRGYLRKDWKLKTVVLEESGKLSVEEKAETKKQTKKDNGSEISEYKTIM